MPEPDAAASAAAMAHFDGQLADPVPSPAEQQHDLRLGIILRIPVGEGQDHPPIGSAETAGAVGQVHSRQHPDNRAQRQAAEPTHQRLLVPGFFQKSRADDQIGLAGNQVLDQTPDLGRAVLPIAVHLHRHIVPVQCGIPVTGLHRPSDTQVERQTHHGHARRHVANRVVRRSIIHHQHIKFRKRLAQPLNDFANRAGLVQDRHNDQAPGHGFDRGVVPHVMHGGSNGLSGQCSGSAGDSREKPAHPSRK